MYPSSSQFKAQKYGEKADTLPTPDAGVRRRPRGGGGEAELAHLPLHRVTLKALALLPRCQAIADIDEILHQLLTDNA
jgi:hypothetical protein